MFLNTVFASFIGAGLLLVLTTSVHAKSLSSTDGPGDVQQAVINLRHSIQNIVNQTAEELAFADLQDDIAALTADVAELQDALQESFADILESYDGASALETLLRDALRKAVQQNPDVAAMILGQGPASGSGSKLTLAIDMVIILEKELEGIDVSLIEKDSNKVSDVVETLFTLSEGVMNTAEWMNDAVNNFIEILASSDLEADHSENEQEQTRQKRSPSRSYLGGGWSLRGHGIQYRRGRWSVSAGPTFDGRRIGARIGLKFRF